MHSEIRQELPGRTVKVWKTSILKEELAHLPAATFAGSISVIDKQEDAEKAIGILAKENEIGFDTETKPSFRRGEKHEVALLQLSTRKECFLFRLNKTGLPECVKMILENPEILKIGVSIHDDFLNLRKKYDLEPCGFIDLQAFVKDYGIADNSLSRIHGILFGKRISKGQRLSNWEADTLTPHQQEYAALDAVACLDIYDFLRNGHFNYKDSKYYRQFDVTLPPTAEKK